MRSSAGQYFAGLDHVRAIAALLVVVWHFSHWTGGQPVPFNQSPLLGPLDEGHLGVSVFMTLSGYLFAKLIGDHHVKYLPFLYNRALRLGPLLIVTMLIYALVNRVDWLSFLKLLVGGLVLPQLPNGGWSITVEAHFYIILPLLLAFFRKSLWWALAGLIASLAMRTALYYLGFDIQALANLTIIGRIDQFILGICAFRLRDKASGRSALMAFIALWIFYCWFDSIGGLFNSGLPSLWLFIPALDGLAVGVMIAWYDRRSAPKFWLLQKAGQYSYSIYLLHFFFAHQAAMAVDQHIMPLTSLAVALPWAALFFLCMIALGHLSWILIEQPPLRWRINYLKPTLIDGSPASDTASRSDQ